MCGIAKSTGSKTYSIIHTDDMGKSCRQRHKEEVNIYDSQFGLMHGEVQLKNIYIEPGGGEI